LSNKNIKKIYIAIPTCDRKMGLRIVLSNLFGLVNKFNNINIAVSYGDEDIRDEWLQLIRNSFSMENDIDLGFYHNTGKNIFESRKFLFNSAKKFKFDWLLYWDDDMIVSNSMFSKMLNILNTTDDSLIQFRQIVPNNEHDYYIKRNNIDKIEFAGGLFAINMKQVDEHIFDNVKLDIDEPGEDRIIGSRIKGNKVRYNNIVVYHLTSKAIGSHFDYKKYYGEENKLWE